MAMQAGGWTITWQGTDTTAADYPKGQTIGRAMAAAIKNAGGSAAISADGSFAERPDVAVVVYGEQPYAEFQGDMPNIAFRANAGEKDMLAKLKAQGIKVVSVFLSGRPLFAGAELNLSDAFVAAWLPGTQGQGVADVLVAGKTGKPARGFTGKLPFPWPVDAVSPVKAPLFPAGYGLTYASKAKVGPVNEDPHVDLVASASEGVYVALGKVPSPWHLSLDPGIAAKAVDLGAQEDAQAFAWSEPGAIGIDGPPVDLMRQLDEEFALKLEGRLDAAAGPIAVTMAGATLKVEPAAGPLTLRIPLRCFHEAGGSFKAVGTPLKITGEKGLVLTLRSASIEGVGQTIPCPAK
jgi:beta-glucosidase